MAIKAEWQFIDNDIEELSLFFSSAEAFSGFFSIFSHYFHAKVRKPSLLFQSILGAKV